MDEERFFKGCAISTLAVLILAGVCFLFGFLAGRDVGKGERGEPEVQRDTVWLPGEPVKDVIEETGKQAAGEVVAVLPLAGEDPRPPLPEAADTTGVQEADTARVERPDSAAVIVPLERKTFEGEYYVATVEGYRPSLVSIEVKPPTMVVTETKTYTKPKRWSVTIGPQVGYGITPTGWQPYAGVGVTFGFSF